MPLVPVPTIDPGLGNVPDPADDEAIFDADAFDFTSRMPGFGDDIKAIGDATYANAQWAETKAGEATTSANNASDSAATATTAKNDAVSAKDEAVGLVEKYQGALATDPALDKTGNPLSDGDWYVNSVTGFIRAYTVLGGWVNGISAVSGVSSLNGLTGPINSPTQAEAEAGAESTKPMNALRTAQAIAALGYNGRISRDARTSNTALSASDKAKWIDITSGTFTQTLNSAASLGAGWWCYLGNSGTGDITLDPEGSELIDGLASYVMYPGEVRLLQCDGSSFKTVVVNAFYKQFTSSASFIKPPGYSLFQGFLWGSGASGSKGSSAPRYGSGGGGGACNPFSLLSSQLAASETITISGATTPPTTNNAGNTGGTSSIGSLVYAYGGGGGDNDLSGGGGGGILSSGSGSNGGNPARGYFSGSEFTCGAFGGAYGARDSSYGGAGGGGTQSAGGKSSHGGGGGGGSDPSTLRAGGVSVYGGKGGDGGVGLSGNGQDGTAPGGGGGGSANGTPGSGARGELIIWGVV